MKYTNNIFHKAYNIINKSECVFKTPLEKNNILSEKYGCNIYLKREDLQSIRSFKIRGPTYKLSINLEKELSNKKNIRPITASAGNHAQGVAMISNSLNLQHDIFVPINTPKQKIDKIKYFGKEYLNLHLVGNTFDEALYASKEYEYNFKNYDKDKDFINPIFIHPFDDDDIIIGNSTIATEIYNEIKPDIIIGTIGGGGLLSGISSYSKFINPDCKIYGVQPKYADSMKQSIEINKLISLNQICTFVDGASVKTPGRKTFDICKNNIDKIYNVNNNKLCSNLIDLYQDSGIISEPAGCLPICILDEIQNIKNKNIVCILSGGNNDITRYNEMLEKAAIHKNLKHYFILNFIQKPGQLKSYVNLILDIDDDIFRFEYLKKNNREFGSILIGIETTNINNILNNMDYYNYKYKKIEENDILYNYLI